MANTPADDIVIWAKDLSKKYKDFVAVDGIDFQVRRGESFGLLGPNGAGKTTIFNSISGLVTPTAGTIALNGAEVSWPASHELVDYKISRTLQGVGLFSGLTVLENVMMGGDAQSSSNFFKDALGFSSKAENALREKALTALAWAGALDMAAKMPGDLTYPETKRVSIARALVSEPDILMLDEPTTGLDPQARHILWDRLFRLKETGVTLVLTTHFMDEAEQLCDRLVVMDKGKIMAEGSPLELIKTYSTKEVLEVRFGSERNKEVAPILREMCDRIEELPDRILMYVEDGEALLETILSKKLHPTTSLVRRSSLEDVFLRLTGRSLIE